MRHVGAVAPSGVYHVAKGHQDLEPVGDHTSDHDVPGGRPCLESLNCQQLFQGDGPQAEAHDGKDHHERSERGPQPAGEDLALWAAVPVEIVAVA